MKPEYNTNEYQVIYFNEMEIAGLYESNATKEAVQLYFPHTLLIFIETGTFHVKYREKQLSFPPKSFFLIRKYTPCTLNKTYEQQESKIKFYVFALTNELLREVIAQYDFPKNTQPVGERVIQLQATPQLNDVIQLLEKFIQTKKDFNNDNLQNTTKKALEAIIQTNEELAAIFKTYTLAERVDLVDFMEYHFLQNKTIKELAKEAGRSLSTFHREFKLIFNETPHHWILQKRLEYAKRLLVNTDKKVSEVYNEAGFKDLTHFGKAFKKAFGVSPSTFQNQISP